MEARRFYGVALVLLTLPLVSCGTSENCSSQATTDTLMEAINQPLSSLKIPPGKFSLRLDAVRTIARDADTQRYSCRANLVATVDPKVASFFANVAGSPLPQDRAVAEGASFTANSIASTINYTVQPTDDGQHIYVEVSGHEPVVRILTTADALGGFVDAPQTPSKPHVAMDYKALKEPWMKVCPTYVQPDQDVTSLTKAEQTKQVCECVWRNPLDKYQMEALVADPDDKDLLAQLPTDPHTGNGRGTFERDVKSCAGVLRYVGQPVSGGSTGVAGSNASEDEWTFAPDGTGVQMKSRTASVHLFKSCEAESPEYGSGKWEWANAGWRAVFPTKTLAFPHRDPPMEDDNKCQMQ